jgi:hypothetical protein
LCGPGGEATVLDGVVTWQTPNGTWTCHACYETVSQSESCGSCGYTLVNRPLLVAVQELAFLASQITGAFRREVTRTDDGDDCGESESDTLCDLNARAAVLEADGKEEELRRLQEAMEATNAHGNAGTFEPEKQNAKGNQWLCPNCNVSVSQQMASRWSFSPPNTLTSRGPEPPPCSRRQTGAIAS